jgi:hypothetical protein
LVKEGLGGGTHKRCPLRGPGLVGSAEKRYIGVELIFSYDRY